MNVIVFPTARRSITHVHADQPKSHSISRGTRMRHPHPAKGGDDLTPAAKPMPLLTMARSPYGRPHSHQRACPGRRSPLFRGRWDDSLRCRSILSGTCNPAYPKVGVLHPSACAVGGVLVLTWFTTPRPESQLSPSLISKQRT